MWETNVNHQKLKNTNKKLKIWGKAQRESARRFKSDYGKNLGGEIARVAKSRARTQMH